MGKTICSANCFWMISARSFLSRCAVRFENSSSSQLALASQKPKRHDGEVMGTLACQKLYADSTMMMFCINLLHMVNGASNGAPMAP